MRDVGRLPLLLAAGTLLCGCVSGPALQSPGDAVIVTEAGLAEMPSEAQSARAAAVAEMRMQAEAAGGMRFPPAYQTEQSRRLATRQEPKSMAEVAAIEAELAAIAARRGAADPAEVAALEARARELRRLVAAKQAAAEN